MAPQVDDGAIQLSSKDEIAWTWEPQQSPEQLAPFPAVAADAPSVMLPSSSTKIAQRRPEEKNVSLSATGADEGCSESSNGLDDRCRAPKSTRLLGLNRRSSLRSRCISRRPRRTGKSRRVAEYGCQSTYRIYGVPKGIRRPSFLGRLFFLFKKDYRGIQKDEEFKVWCGLARTYVVECSDVNEMKVTSRFAKVSVLFFPSPS